MNLKAIRVFDAPWVPVPPKRFEAAFHIATLLWSNFQPRIQLRQSAADGRFVQSATVSSRLPQRVLPFVSSGL